MLKRDFIAAVTAQASQVIALRFEVDTDRVLTTRQQGAALRARLEERFHLARPEQLEVAFSEVDAVTISFVDEFLGRFLTELVAAEREPVLVTLSGLTDDTASEVEAVLQRRKLLAAAVVDARPSLLAADKHLRSTFLEAVRMGRFSPQDLSAALEITPQNANNRLKRLVEMGALGRRRSDPAAGGREYSYEVSNALIAGLAR